MHSTIVDKLTWITVTIRYGKPCSYDGFRIVAGSSDICLTTGYNNTEKKKNCTKIFL